MKIKVIVTDQGNGGAYCENCGKEIIGEGKFPSNCPHCGVLFTEIEEPKPYPFGGSDF